MDPGVAEDARPGARGRAAAGYATGLAFARAMNEATPICSARSCGSMPAASKHAASQTPSRALRRVLRRWPNAARTTSAKRAGSSIPTVPGSLAASLAALEADHDFLTEGDVFTEDFIENYLAYKREKEVDPIRLRPHPYEFVLYYDI